MMFQSNMLKPAVSVDDLDTIPTVITHIGVSFTAPAKHESADQSSNRLPAFRVMRVGAEDLAPCHIPALIIHIGVSSTAPAKHESADQTSNRLPAIRVMPTIWGGRHPPPEQCLLLTLQKTLHPGQLSQAGRD